KWSVGGPGDTTVVHVPSIGWRTCTELPSTTTDSHDCGDTSGTILAFGSHTCWLTQRPRRGANAWYTCPSRSRKASLRTVNSVGFRVSSVDHVRLTHENARNVVPSCTSAQLCSRRIVAPGGLGIEAQSGSCADGAVRKAEATG